MEVANLMRNYLPPDTSVIDVGCGAGAYGLGLEVDPHCCEILRRRQLPFREVDAAARVLPAADAEWDCAICI